MKIRPVGSEFFNADRGIDTTKHIVAFGILAMHLKMYCVIYPSSYPVSIFVEAFHKLLAIKNCFVELFWGKFRKKNLELKQVRFRKKV